VRQDATDEANRLESNSPAMKTSVIEFLVCATLVSLAFLWPSQNASGRARGINDVPECVSVRNALRPSGYGYDHVVYVRNRCEVTVECTVGSSRNPKPEFGLVVPPGLEKGVVTRTHAKKRHFKSSVRCTLRAGA
jgi:hypothetical protein